MTPIIIPDTPMTPIIDIDTPNTPEIYPDTPISSLSSISDISDIESIRSMVSNLDTEDWEQALQRVEKMFKENVKFCKTRKYKMYVLRLKRAETKQEKVRIFHILIEELFRELVVAPEYGTPSEDLVMSVYRWLRNQWNDSVEQNGDDLLHEAFTLNKIINGKELGDRDRRALITAFFQDRKTFVAIAVLAVYLAAGYTPIVIATASNQAEQIKDRILESFKDIYHEMTTEKGYKPDELYMFTEVLFQDSKMSTADRNEVKKRQNEAVANEKPRSNRCIVTFKEYTQIRPWVEIMERKNSCSRVLTIIDEAHKNGGFKNLVEEEELQGQQNCQWDQYIFALKTFSDKVIYITATPAKVMMSDLWLWTDNIFLKKRHPGYRGPEMIQYHTNMPKHNDKEELWNRIIEIFTDISGTPPITRKHKELKNSDVMPHIVLVHFESELNKMTKAFHSFRADGNMPEEVKNGNWLTCTYFGEGIRIWHQTLVDEKIIIDNCFSFDMGNGEHFFSSKINGGISFNGLLQWLGANGGVKRFPRIAIFAYDMAWEGISFSTHKAPFWHLNNIIVSGEHTADAISQLIGRLHGIHNDNVVQHCYCSNSNKYKAVKEVSFVLEDMVRKVKAIKNMRVVEVIGSIEWYKNRVPNKFISPMKKASAGPLALKTKINPDAAKEHRKIYRSDNAIDIFCRLHPELYTDIQKRMEENIRVVFENEDSDNLTDKRDPETWNENDLRDMAPMEVLKKMIQKYDDGKFKTAKEWLDITGVCGYGSRDAHHFAMSRLSSNNFLERKGVKGSYLFRLIKN